jgi:hypothetical protein
VRARNSGDMAGWLRLRLGDLLGMTVSTSFCNARPATELTCMRCTGG